MYLWRSGFLDRAMEVIAAEVSAKFGPNPPASRVRNWIANISTFYGAAYWQSPRTSKVRLCSAFQCVLLTPENID